MLASKKTTLQMMRLYIILFAMCFQMANAQDNPNLQGTWAVDINKTLNNIKGENKTKFNSMPENIKASMRKGFETRTFQFIGSQVIIDFTINDSPQHFEGTWRIENDDTLVIRVGEQAMTYAMSLSDNNKKLELLYQDLSTTGL